MDISDRVRGVETSKRVLFTMVVESLVVAMAAMEAGKLLVCLLFVVESASSEGGVSTSGEVDELIKGTRVVVPGRCKVDFVPENKDAGDSDGDDDDDEEEDEDEDGGDQDDGGDEDLSGDEGDDKEGDDDVKDPTVNGEGGSDDDDDEDDDDDDDDDEDADEDDEDEDDEEEDEEPPSKKKK